MLKYRPLFEGGPHHRTGRDVGHALPVGYVPASGVGEALQALAARLARVNTIVDPLQKLAHPGVHMELLSCMSTLQFCDCIQDEYLV